tara:strand:+ start:1491 stop:1949 length:459 start_codon:yes stop_codon:yes gene_type:complete
MTDEYNPDTIDSIIQSVCDFIQINKEDLLSTKRDRLLVDARRITVNILLREESHSVSGVGRCIKKNHATVIHYRNSHVSIYDTNARYRHTYDMCVRKYKGESYSSFQDFLLMGKKVKAVEELLESRDQEIADLKYDILKLEKKVRMNNYQLV